MQPQKGASGLEAIPNIDFWRSFFGYVGAGARVMYYGATCRQPPSLEEDDMMYHGVADDDDVVIKQTVRRGVV